MCAIWWEKHYKLYTVLSSLGVVFLMCIFGSCICLACIVYVYLLYFMCIVLGVFVVLLCVFVVSYVYLFYFLCIFVVPYVYFLYYVCIAVLTLDAGLLTRSQYSEGPATGHLDAGFSWFPCVYKRMLRWFPSFQVATKCLSCSPPDLNFLVTFFPHTCVHVK